MFEQEIDNLKLSELVKQVRNLDAMSGVYPSINIAFLRNITIDTIIPFFKFLCYKENFKANIYMSDYDTVMQDVMDGNSLLYKHNPEIVVICLKIETLAEKLVMNFSQLSQADVNEEVVRVINFINKVLTEIRQKSNAMILINNFETPLYPSFGIYDYQDKTKHINTFREMNFSLLDTVRKFDSVYVVDVDVLRALAGYNNYIDHRYWHIGKAPYTREASKMFAKEYIKFVRAFKGKSRKCLILDCDNTLWGGVIGEDGMGKIEIGKSYPGSGYREFQQAILNLYNRGIMLAICSKNNEQDVLEVFDKHPEMILRKEHFIVMKINWNDKATNIKEISHELNIGLDSLVFIDDSDFEINMVKQIIPEVLAIQLPKEPSKYLDLLSSIGLFDTLAFSDEDSKRNEMYKAEMNRKKTESVFATIEEYYKYLEMEVFINKADKFSIPRISQLTEKTNQFNLTTKRYHESEIKALVKLPDSDVYFLRLKDRFGDSGIVGVVILRYIGKDCLIDTFLLSCRVIGRGVEKVLLNFCIEAGKQKNCMNIIGLYSPTKRNQIVKDFYEQSEFSLIENANSFYRYCLSTNNIKVNYPEYFKTINTDK